MKRRLLILLVLFAAATLVWVFWRQSAGGYYQGKSLVVWAPQAARGDPKAVAAIQAMGAQAVPGLVRLLQARNSPFRQRLWRLQTRLPGLLRRILPGNPVPPALAVSVHEQAAHCLGLLGPKARPAVPALAKALRDPEGRVCWEAAAALARIGPDSVPALTQALEDPHTKARHSAAYALGEIGPPALAAIPALGRACADTNEQVRASAAYSLSVIGTPPILAHMAELLDHGNPAARQAAAKVLLDWCIGLRATSPALVRMLHDPTPEVRRQALETLGAIRAGDAVAIGTAAAALKDPELQVRLAAVRAIALIGYRAQAALPGLTNCLNDPSPELRDAATNAIRRIETR